jgi:ADP-ribose pyrophosphatase YjhB (NUDIX family)
MADAYLAVQRVSRGASDILLAQKNIYLPPHGKYQYASIARNAVQYVIPGGRIQPGEQPAAAAVRELFEDTGVQIPATSLQQVIAEPGSYWVYKVTNPADLDVDAINAALADGRTGSLKVNNVVWAPLDQAPCRFGNKDEYQALPWVATQILRALNAGFSREVIGLRANEPHTRYTRACAQLILDAYGPVPPATAVSAVVTPTPAPVGAS